MSIHAEPGPHEQLVGQSSAADYGATLEQFYLTSDGTDWAPAFERFLAGTSGRLRLSCSKEYDIKSTINICRPVIIEGCGTTQKASTIYAARGITAIAVRSAAYCGTGADGSGTRLKDVFIRERSGDTAQTLRFGVLMESPATLDRVRIWNFSNGVRMDADLARSGTAATNADGWSINDLTVNNADHAGVIAIGANTSNGLANKVNVTSNCWDADKLGVDGTPLYPVEGATGPLFPSCAGFIDSSKWGSTWVAAHSANSKDANLTGAATATTYYPPGRFLGTARGVCVGCYQENQGVGVTSYVDAIELNTSSVGLSGEASYAGGGVALQSRGVPALAVDNLSLVSPTIVPRVVTGTNFPILFRIWRTAGEPDLRIEQDNAPASGCSPSCARVRGSYQGLSAQTAWRWLGDPASFIGFP